MPAETIIPALSLLVQIAKLCQELLARRRRGKNTRKIEADLVRLLVDLFDEIKFCQDVADSVRNFQSFFGLSVYRLQEFNDPSDVGRQVRAIDKRFRTEFLSEIAAVVEDKRGRMVPDPIPDVGKRQLRIELVRAAANYHDMIECIGRLTLNFPGELQEMSRDKDGCLEAFSTKSVQFLEDIRDHEVATLRSLVRTGAHVTNLIS